MTQRRSEDCFARSSQHLVGGVNSPVRGYGAVGGGPVFVERGEGAEIVGVDGKRYVDYVLSYGPLALGHAHPDVVRVLEKTLRLGTTFGAPTELETELAEYIKQCYGYVDKVRFVSSGTEAAMSAVRLARGVTGKSIVVKFKGCYHGHVDALLVAAGSGVATLGVADSAGVLPDVVSHTAVLDYNNPTQVRSFFEHYGENVAAVLMEPVSGNMGVIVPSSDFVQTCRECCSAAGALLVFDEVMCGFRAQKTGTHEWIGVKPDIVLLGKVIGGGLPCGAYAASAEIMSHVAPEGPVYQAGTLSGNPMAMAAGLMTLKMLVEEGGFDRAFSYTKRLVAGMRALCEEKGVRACINSRGTMFTVFFGSDEIKSFNDVDATSDETFKAYFHKMLAKGVFLPPSKFEACFTSAVHDDAHLEQTLIAFSDAII